MNLHMRTLSTWARLEATTKTREHPVNLHMRTLTTWARLEPAVSTLTTCSRRQTAVRIPLGTPFTPPDATATSAQSADSHHLRRA